MTELIFIIFSYSNVDSAMSTVPCIAQKGLSWCGLYTTYIITHACTAEYADLTTEVVRKQGVVAARLMR